MCESQHHFNDLDCFLDRLVNKHVLTSTGRPDTVWWNLCLVTRPIDSYWIVLRTETALRSKYIANILQGRSSSLLIVSIWYSRWVFAYQKFDAVIAVLLLLVADERQLQVATQQKNSQNGTQQTLDLKHTDQNPGVQTQGSQNTVAQTQERLPLAHCKWSCVADRRPLFWLVKADALE